jgi:hypothetical protein
MPDNQKYIKMLDVFPPPVQAGQEMDDHTLVAAIRKSIKRLEAENKRLRKKTEMLKDRLYGPF